MENKKKRFYSLSDRTQAKSLAKHLNENDYEKFLDIVTDVPQPLINMALNETERIGNLKIIPRSRADSFISRLKFYSKTFGIRFPENGL